MKTFVLIDGNALLHRAYHALPPLKTKAGQLVNAVYGFISILFKVIKDLRPDYLAVTFDLAGPTFRDKQFKDYKSKRIKPPQEFYDQIPLTKEIINALKIPIYEKKGFEADDVIGTIIQRLKNRLLKKIIISGDLDTLQLVGKLTEVHAPKKGISQQDVYNQAAVRDRYHLEPEQIVDFKALKGDPSDNIPGVLGIGEKTAINLIKKFGSLERIYRELLKSDLDPKLKARLLEYKKEAFLSRDLATIKKDVPLDFDVNSCQWLKSSHIKAAKLLEELGFKSLVKRLSEI